MTAVGTGVDDAVRRIATRYTVRGQVETITSYDDPAVGTGTVLNEVQYLYNAFNQLIADYQNHSGAVDMVTTPKVAYTYTDGSSGHVRPTQLVYPNGRILRYEYNSGTDDAVNRVSFLADDASGAVGTHLAEYAYLGLGQFVQVTYPEPNLRYDLAHGTGDDPYDGLDRFDRIVDLVWRNQTQSTDVERIQHAYDRAGNRLWRETPVAAANGVHLDELYTYDGMNQLVTFNRGRLNPTKTGLIAGTKNLAQAWSLDATGNWASFQEDTNGDGAWDLTQPRTHNPVNEITEIASSSDHVAHDRVGNTIKMPQPDAWSSHYDLTYDAWNRLVKVADSETPVAEYQYDGRGYRTTKSFAGTTLQSYYSSRWQVLEERVGVLTSADRQFTWGLRYIDDLLLRDRDTCDEGALDERFYTLQDANWNVVAICNTTGAIQERCTYTAYGVPCLLTGSFSGRTLSAYDWETHYCGYRWDESIASYHVRHRVLISHLGRWNRHDSIGYRPDLDLYRYVGGSPMRMIDPSGLWGEDVHYDMTKRWAFDHGLTKWAAGVVAKADIGVDGGETGPFPNWVTAQGDWQQAYHFNRDVAGGFAQDTRLRLCDWHLKVAKRYASPQVDDPENAAKQLGIALHPVQDWVAHGDYGIRNPRFAFIHNSAVPPIAQYPLTWGSDPSKYPDDITLDAVGSADGRPAGKALHRENGLEYAIYTKGQKRSNLTWNRSHKVLQDFTNYVRTSGGPKSKCKLLWKHPGW